MRFATLSLFVLGAVCATACSERTTSARHPSRRPHSSAPGHAPAPPTERAAGIPPPPPPPPSDHDPRVESVDPALQPADAEAAAALGSHRYLESHGLYIPVPEGWSAITECGLPCVLVLRSNQIAGGIMPFVKLEVMNDIPGTFEQMRSAGAESYGGQGGSQLLENVAAQLGQDPAFDLIYQVPRTPYVQQARHALRAHTLFVLTASGPSNRADPKWRTLRAILGDTRWATPTPAPQPPLPVPRAERQPAGRPSAGTTRAPRTGRSAPPRAHSAAH